MKKFFAIIFAAAIIAAVFFHVRKTIQTAVLNDAEIISFERFEEIKKIVIENIEDTNEVYVINSAEDIEILIAALGHVQNFVWPYAREIEAAHYVNFINDFTVIRFLSPGRFTREQFDTINSFLTDENRSYQYIFFASDFSAYEEIISENAVVYLQNNFMQTVGHPSDEAVFMFQTGAAPVENDLRHYEIRVIFETEQSPDDLENFRQRYGVN
jgi:hypothetical protein